MIKLADKKIVVATHYLIYSSSQALRDHLKNNDAHVFYVSHPLPSINPNQRERSYMEITKGNKLVKREKAKKRYSILPITMLYEMFIGLKWLLSGRNHYDLYIGVDNFNAIIGLILKSFGRADKVVYYTIDYFPKRYENPFLNRIYHLIDKLCVRYADETWNVSKNMVGARKKFNNMDPRVYRRQYEVPVGIWFKNAPRKPFSKINKKKLVFVGHLLKHMGVDLVIESMPLILKKIPDVKFEIIGGGDELNNLKQLSKDLKVEKNIKFWGWVRERTQLEKIMSDGAVGLATFNTKILDSKVKNADPGKIKDYMLLGMPIIVTDAISTGKILTDNKCAIIVSYEKKELANAVVTLLSDQKKLAEYRGNALSYIEQFDYEKIYKKNLERVFNG